MRLPSFLRVKTFRANVWILDLKTKKLRSLTDVLEIQGDSDEAGWILSAVMVAGRQMDCLYFRSQHRMERAR